MIKKIFPKAQIACLVLLILGLIGCEQISGIFSNKISTVKELAVELRKQGIKIAKIGPVKHKFAPAKVDEALTLKGVGLHVDVLRIEDRKTFEQFGRLAAFTGGLTNLAGKNMRNNPESIKEVILRRPFAVVIKQEPRKGSVRQALDKIIPDKSS